jgi:hypothetical protein
MGSARAGLVVILGDDLRQELIRRCIDPACLLDTYRLLPTEFVSN